MLHDAGRFLALVNPAIALLLALCFLFAWHHERTRPHLLQLGACYLLAAAAIGLQVLWPPRAGGGPATIAGALYLGSAALLLHGMLARIGARPDRCAGWRCRLRCSAWWRGSTWCIRAWSRVSTF